MSWRYDLPKCPVSPEDRGEFMKERPEQRCPICDWPMASSREKGCVPGDCSYRPDDPAEQQRIRLRRKSLASPVSTTAQCGAGEAVLPCPFCGCTDIELWSGYGTQADIMCSECCCERSVQVVDLFDRAERPTFDEKTCRYPDDAIARVNEHLIGEWNTRSTPPAPVRAAQEDAVRDALAAEIESADAARRQHRKFSKDDFEIGQTQGYYEGLRKAADILAAKQDTHDRPPQAWLDAKAERDAGWPDAAPQDNPQQKGEG